MKRALKYQNELDELGAVSFGLSKLGEVSFGTSEMSCMSEV